MELITVYTPTYNRSSLLPRVYDCLCRQTVKDFIWLIIDDGSTDNTADLVESWKKENVIKIDYIYKENGGVHTARDVAYKACQTELMFSCDSDDWVVDNAIEVLTDFWKQNGGENYAGIFVATATDTGEPICTKFPKVKEATYQDFTYKYKCSGDKLTVVKSEIMSKIPDAPIFKDEKLVGEDYKWIQLPEDKPFLILETPLYIVEYQNMGLSNTVNNNRFKNANGFREDYKMHILKCKYLKPRLKGHIGFIAFSLILKEKHFLKKSPKPVRTFFMMPFGILAYWYFCYKKKKAGR